MTAAHSIGSVTMMALRRATKAVAISGASAVAVGAAALYVDAPQADLADCEFEKSVRPPVFPTWVHDMGRVPTILAGTIVSKVFIKHLNTLTASGIDLLEHYVDNRPDQTALITVSNHTATVDDPAILARWATTFLFFSFHECVDGSEPWNDAMCVQCAAMEVCAAVEDALEFMQVLLCVCVCVCVLPSRKEYEHVP